jgi:hypothetical protein
MPRRAEEPLDKRKNLTLFQGDWERLDELLKPTGVATGTFLRLLVRKKIVQLEAAANAAAGPTEPIDPSFLVESLESSGPPIA